MGDSEKLMALKKAYAEIILNTATEAAARIMASERKALRYQQELISAKDEAPRLLLRLKHMLDSKVREEEIASLNRQMKIEELEAQLQEAEDIVKDLREELEQVQAELDKVRNNQVQFQEEPNLRSGPEEMLHEDRSSDMNKYIFNNQVHNSGFASIVVRSEESELYRNGCTQRIWACVLDEKLSRSGRTDEIESESASTVIVDECGVEKTSDIFKAIREYEEDSVLSQAVTTSFCCKRKRANRCKNRKVPSCSISNSHHSMEIEAQKDLQLQSESPETVTQHVEALHNEMTVKQESEIASEVSCSKNDATSACDLTDNRFLKYTFRRKRKRELLKSSVGVDNSTLKKDTKEKQDPKV